MPISSLGCLCGLDAVLRGVDAMVWVVNKVEPVVVKKISRFISDRGSRMVDMMVEKMRTWGKHLCHKKMDGNKSVKVMVLNMKR